MHTAAGVFGAAAASICLVDETTGELVYQSAWGAGAREIVGVRLPPGAGHRRAGGAESASAEAVPDCRTDPRFAARIAAGTGYVPYTMLVVPLRARRSADRRADDPRSSRRARLPQRRPRARGPVRRPRGQGARRHAELVHEPRHDLARIAPARPAATARPPMQGAARLLAPSPILRYRPARSGPRLSENGKSQATFTGGVRRMTGLCGCLIRRIAGLVGVLVAVALIAAPVALANDDTITAQATVQFSGVVDNPAVVHAPRPPRSTGATAPRRRPGPINASRRGQRHAHLRHQRTPTTARSPSPAATAPLRRVRRRRLLHGQRQHGPADVHAVPAGLPRQRLPVPDHRQQRHRNRHAGPQPGPVRGSGRLADRRAEQLVLAGLRAPAFGPELGPVWLRRRRHLRPRRQSDPVRMRATGGRSRGHRLPGPVKRLLVPACPRDSPRAISSRARRAPGSHRTATKARRAGSRTYRPTRPPESSTSRRRSLRAGRPTSASRSRRSGRRIGVGGTAPLPGAMSPPDGHEHGRELLGAR